LSAFASAVRSGLDMVLTFFTKTLPEWLGRAWDAIQSGLKAAWDWINRYIVAPLSDAFSKFIDWVRSGLTAVADFFTKTLPGWLKTAWDWIQGALKSVWDWIQTYIVTPLAKGFEGFIGWIRSGIDALTTFFTRQLPGWIDTVAKQLSELPQKVWNSLVVAGQTIWEYITNLGRGIVEGFAKVGEILNTASQYLLRLGAMITGGFSQLGTALAEFTNALKNIPNVFKSVVDFFSRLWEELQSFVKDPIKWITEKVISPIWSGLQWIGGKLLLSIPFVGFQVWTIPL